MSISSLRKINQANFIHPTAVLDESVVIGEGNYIGPFCIVGKGVVIGNNNRLEAHCSIGTPPEHKKYWHGSFQSVIIGNNCVIREYATVNSGTITNTLIGDDVSLLHASYVAHDCIIGNNVTVSGNSAMGGHCHIFEGANIGLNVSIHQYSVIGHYSMVGMGTVVAKKSVIEPIKTYVGSPARFLKINQYAIDKYGLTTQNIADFTQKFDLQLQSKYRQLKLQESKT